MCLIAELLSQNNFFLFLTKFPKTLINQIAWHAHNVAAINSASIVDKLTLVAS